MARFNQPFGWDQLKQYKPNNVGFSVFSCEELEKLSVTKVITPLSFNTLGHPLPGGLYDSRLGPFEQNSPCGTCGQNMLSCPGHMGHIELPLPVINPIFFKSIVTILKLSCLNCYRVLIPGEIKYLVINQMKLLNAGFIAQAREMTDYFSYLNPTFASTPEEIGQQLHAVEAINNYVDEVLSKGDAKITASNKGEGDYRNEILKFTLSHLNNRKKCPYCSVSWKKITVLRGQILYSATKVEVASKFKSKDSVGKSESLAGMLFMTATECMKICQKIGENESQFLELLVPVLKNSTSEHPTDLFFMNLVPVPPTNTRPVNYLNGQMVEHIQNNIYKEILNDCLIIKSIIHLLNNEESDNLTAERKEIVSNLRGSTLTEKLQFSWQGLQNNVDCLLDVDLKRRRNFNGVGLKQVIEKKAGIIRMNMMGKRVNFAARSVIAPDPNLNIDEIGVPEVFAKKLTYPVPITVWNVTELRKMVINGPEVHPGANMVENEDGSIVKLSPRDVVQRESIAKRLLTPGDMKGVKILHRHLLNGDILLLNRQPTLHRPSIMGHRARILKGEKTLRLHYANCKAYNADFDGDEMNAHFPQNEVARSEGYNLVNVCKQYLVPKDGTPLSGLIQDHMIAGVRLSIRGKFFRKDQYMQLVFQGLSYLQGDIKLLPPAIIKPIPLWSGKQVISTVIINVIPKGKKTINLESVSKIPANAWETGTRREWKAGGTPFKSQSTMTEGEVIIRGGELLCGVLDKTHYGATPYSLVHCMYELYGGETSSRLLSSFAKLFTAFLQREGFTLGVKDILVIRSADKQRREYIKKVRQIGDDVARKALDLAPDSQLDLKTAIEEAYGRIPMFRAILDHEYKKALDSFTNNINKVCIPSGLFSPFPKNNLQLMVQSGAKGSTVNTMQISCLLGQIELEGKRPPIMISGRSLPSFPKYDTSPRAGGFIDGRFMTGIQPQEFFFHCMAGREGLIDTAVKTSRSGYLQRCLVKHFEGLTVNYDMTVRDSDGSVIQFAYGEDGMEIGKCQFLKQSELPFLIENIDAAYDSEIHNSLLEGTDSQGIKEHRKKIKKWLKHFKGRENVRGSGFTDFSQDMFRQLGSPLDINKKTGRSKRVDETVNMWRSLDDETKEHYKKKWERKPDPVTSKFQADRHVGSITEKLEAILNSYTIKNADMKNRVRDMFEQKVSMALCSPGEPVGLLAAQSVGEPSTQMTLNTFHFAGRGEMNVTLGIPRLREILMVASKNIKTPTMEIPFRKDIKGLEKYSQKLRKYLTRVTLADLLESISVTEKFQIKPIRKQIYILKLNFLPHSSYKDSTDVKPKQILRHVEKTFLKELALFTEKKSKKALEKELITSEQETAQRAMKFDDDEAGEGKEAENGAGQMDSKSKKAVVGAADDYQSSEEEEEGADDDATTVRRRQRQQEEQQYSDMEDELDEETREEMGGEEEGEVMMDEEEETGKAKESGDREMDEEEEANRNFVLSHHQSVEDYKYDRENYRWCEVILRYSLSKGRIDFGSILKEAAGRSVVSQIPGIKRAFITPSSSSEGGTVLKTDGLNFGEMYTHSKLLDINKLYSNDVHAIANTYGIEAASRVVVKEIQDVFKVYGITVDPRHLNLIADYMTWSGVYLPLNRKGMEGSSSPLLQMSFEASLAFLKSSVLRSRVDSLSSPSARIMLGQPCRSGTGAFHLMQKITC